jgi:hypothetical protein
MQVVSIARFRLCEETGFDLGGILRVRAFRLVAAATDAGLNAFSPGKIP